jgi:alginate O-acetyltransferase complex protein AlgI
MLFNSFTFLLFFLIVYAAFWLLPDWNRRKLLLLVASYVFYGAWSPPYVGILLFSTVLDWWLARLIDRSDDPRRRKLMMLLSLACNLGLLGYFKYGQFLVDNSIVALSFLGVHYSPPAADIVLPIGISFYTFASLSYTIDVYRREIKADSSFREYALFVSFFPHLVAGPIVRASKLLPQLRAPRMPGADQVGWGLLLVLFGLFGKVVMADRIFAPLVDEVYAAPAKHGAVDAWAAVLGFSGQIYFDFSGYSLCAIGLALMFGFAFPDNFRYPYAARGFSDFWRRWHISLSTWLRDYLYISLGGNRGGEWKTYRNLFLTMLIGGFWHGASWMFVLWGGLHGTYLALERLLQGRAGSRGGGNAWWADYLYPLLTFLVVTLTWIPFRAATPAIAAGIASGLLRFDVPRVVEMGKLAPALLGAAATLCWHFLMRDTSLEAAFASIGRLPQRLMVGACFVALFLCSGGGQRAFIYFQF